MSTALLPFRQIGDLIKKILVIALYHPDKDTWKECRKVGSLNCTFLKPQGPRFTVLVRQEFKKSSEDINTCSNHFLRSCSRPFHMATIFKSHWLKTFILGPLRVPWTRVQTHHPGARGMNSTVFDQHGRRVTRVHRTTTTLQALLFSNSVWDLQRPSVLMNLGCETGATVYRSYPRRLESLTTCGWNYKGSTSSSVI